MQPDLRSFLIRLARTVAVTLVPVALTAFLSMPWTLGRHPGESPPGGVAAAASHMT